MTGDESTKTLGIVRSIDRRQLLVVVVALMCLTALPGASSAAGGGDVRMPSNHTDFGTGDEPAPEVLENFSVGGSGDSASLSGPVGGTKKGGGLVSSGDTISWSEGNPSTSESVINVTGVDNSEPGSVGAGETQDGDNINLQVGGNSEATNATVSFTGSAPAQNPVDTYGDGDTDLGSSSLYVGDNNIDTKFSTSVKIAPENDIAVNQLTFDISDVEGSDYGAQADIYISEGEADDTYNEGTLVGTWDPTWSTGKQTVDISEYQLTGGNNYEIEIVTDTTDSDDTADRIEFATDDSASSAWAYSNGFGRDLYVDVRYGEPPTESPSIDLGSDGSTEASVSGTIQNGKTVTKTLPNISPSTDTAKINAVRGPVDVSLSYTENAKTIDPVVELNGDSSQNVSVDGSLGEGETVIKEIDNSWLESGENTATVTLNDSGLDADDPPMEAKVSVEKPAQSARYVSAAYDNLSRSNGVGVDWSGSGTLDVTVQGWTGSSWEDARQLSTSETGDVVLDYEPIGYEQTRVEIVANDNVEIREESLQFFTSTPELDEGSATPASGDGVSESPVELSINASDADFGTIQGDEVDVTFYNGNNDSPINTKTITTDRPVSTVFNDPQPTSNSWYVIAKDQYGNTIDSRDINDGEFQFQAPGEIEVRNELKPNQLIDGNSSLRARAFADGDVIFERGVTDGTVSLEGVPLNEEIVITVREENADYVYRRILIESAIETSEIYLLPTDEPSAQIRYQLRDDTGRFGDSGNTRFFVEKPITRDYDNDGTDETRYQVISGDRLGADGEFPTILVDSERYRLRVENDAGEQRVLGSYVVQGATQSTIPIGSVEFTGNVDEGAALQTNLREAPEGASHDHEVRLVYVDPEGETSEIDISITNGTGGTIRPTSTEQINGTAAYVETYPITQPFNPEEDTATVEVVATRGFEQETFTQQLGDVPPVDIGPLPQELVELAALASILAVLGLLVIINPAMAALVTPGYAGLLVVLGLAPIPMFGVVLAGLIGVLASVASRGG